MATGNIKQDAANLLRIIVMSPSGIGFRDLLNQSGMLPEDMKKGLSLLYGPPELITYAAPPTGGVKLYMATPAGIDTCNKGLEIQDKPAPQSGNTGEKFYLWIGKDANWSTKEVLAYPSSSYKNFIVHLEEAWALIQELVKDLDGVMSGELDAYAIQGTFDGKEQNGKIHVKKPIKVEQVTGTIKGLGSNVPVAPGTGGTAAPQSLAQAFENASTDSFDSIFGGDSDLPWGDIGSGSDKVISVDDDGDLPF